MPLWGIKPLTSWISRRTRCWSSADYVDPASQTAAQSTGQTMTAKSVVVRSRSSSRIDDWMSYRFTDSWRWSLSLYLPRPSRHSSNNLTSICQVSAEATQDAVSNPATQCIHWPLISHVVLPITADLYIWGIFQNRRASGFWCVLIVYWSGFGELG